MSVKTGRVFIVQILLSVFHRDFLTSDVPLIEVLISDIGAVEN